MKNIPNSWLNMSDWDNEEIFHKIVNNLCQAKKVPKYVYPILLGIFSPTKHTDFWEELSLSPNSEEWDKIHLRNFKCSIDSRIRSFYFKLFHKAISLNDFLHKIKRKDSPNCTFCHSLSETIIHVFIDCDIVKIIWNEIVLEISRHTKKVFNPSPFEKIFGVKDDKFITYIFLIFKYYIYLCKFKNNIPSFQGFKVYLKSCKETEYRIAKKKGTLALHFRKWKYVF